MSMMAFMPEATKLFGKRSLVVAPTGITVTGEPGAYTIPLTQITAATNDNISCYIYKGAGLVTGETSKVTAPARECETVERESFGPTKLSMANLEYVWGPQAPDDDPVNAAWSALQQGNKVFLIERLGFDNGSAFAADQYVTIYYVELDRQNAQPKGEDASAEAAIVQGANVLQEWTRVKITA